MPNTSSRYEEGPPHNHIFGRILIASWDKLMLGGGESSKLNNSIELGSASLRA